MLNKNIKKLTVAERDYIYKIRDFLLFVRNIPKCLKNRVLLFFGGESTSEAYSERK